MAINKHLWRSQFSDKAVPKYPCPKCGKGKLVWNKEKYANLEPAYSKRDHDEEGWDPDWISSRFVGFSICDMTFCGEIVAISGSSSVDHEYGWDDAEGTHTDEWVTMLRPSSMTPTPHLFPLPKSIPDPIRKDIVLAFSLYWTDLSASTSRLRTSLEMVLDDQKVPRKTDKPNPKGKGLLNLEQRIMKFAEAAGDEDAAASMDALRVVGNLGTHGESVKEQDYFDLLDLYEHALLEIYEQLSAKRKATQARLKALSDKAKSGDEIDLGLPE